MLECRSFRFPLGKLGKTPRMHLINPIPIFLDVSSFAPIFTLLRSANIHLIKGSHIYESYL